MPTLPTFTVTDAQAARLIAAFGSAAAYKEWLKHQITAYVTDFETKADAATFNANAAARRAEIESSLNS